MPGRYPHVAGGTSSVIRGSGTSPSWTSDRMPQRSSPARTARTPVSAWLLGGVRTVSRPEVLTAASSTVPTALTTKASPAPAAAALEPEVDQASVAPAAAALAAKTIRSVAFDKAPASAVVAPTLGSQEAATASAFLVTAPAGSSGLQQAADCEARLVQRTELSLRRLCASFPWMCYGYDEDNRGVLRGPQGGGGQEAAPPFSDAVSRPRLGQSSIQECERNGHKTDESREHHEVCPSASAP
mmetsp:Transcript_96274/g.272129  ORF Transcript_96274/g.272129 Transcript_96274/m.272129 type:complete len:242 (-) Transcript_96274:93-818(-)